MSVSLVTALPSVITPSRSGIGSSGSVQATSAVFDAAPLEIPASSSASSKAGASGMDEALKDPSQNHLAQAIKRVNDAFSQRGQNLYASFEKDKITGIDVVKIVEKKTNEIIRQMPPKEMVAFAQSMEVEQGWRGRLILDKA